MRACPTRDRAHPLNLGVALRLVRVVLREARVRPAGRDLGAAHAGSSRRAGRTCGRTPIDALMAPWVASLTSWRCLTARPAPPRPALLSRPAPRCPALPRPAPPCPTRRVPRARSPPHKNLGTTCYMNTLVHVLFATLPIRLAMYLEPRRLPPPPPAPAPADAADPLQELKAVFARLQGSRAPAVDPSALVRALALPLGEQQDVGEYVLPPASGAHTRAHRVLTAALSGPSLGRFARLLLQLVEQRFQDEGHANVRTLVRDLVCPKHQQTAQLSPDPLLTCSSCIFSLLAVYGPVGVCDDLQPLPQPNTERDRHDRARCEHPGTCARTPPAGCTAMLTDAMVARTLPGVGHAGGCAGAVLCPGAAHRPRPVAC